ncbi:hypothetical protein BVRB_6g142270 [Beta vulgaris subsp. vulgaris]|uniref:Uncharacterized protein n=1 Tax=Beta vulgaris subsp. vulgaris TaxID=3555 RepID=A0A0J8EYF3_BETVV|nr:hypothetical protein BVRB_6g142270 [Beta vulgaris subsp. vulgaris]
MCKVTTELNTVLNSLSFTNRLGKVEISWSNSLVALQRISLYWRILQLSSAQQLQLSSATPAQLSNSSLAALNS